MTEWVIEGRYLVFGGDQYYPLGGWDDLKGRFEYEQDAMAEAIKYEWWQVIDTGEGCRVVASS